MFVATGLAPDVGEISAFPDIATDNRKQETENKNIVGGLYE